MVVKRKRSSTKHRYQWMSNRELSSSILFILIALIVLCLLILYILAIVDREGYALLLYPFAYIFNLYHQASPGEKLTVLYLPVGGILGWFLKQWLSKKR
jgi:hypothetical protein